MSTATPNYKLINEFLKAASSEGVWKASEAFGEVLNAKEAAALAKLSDQELESLADIYQRLTTSLDGIGGGAATPDWTCNVC